MLLEKDNLKYSTGLYFSYYYFQPSKEDIYWVNTFLMFCCPRWSQQFKVYLELNRIGKIGGRPIDKAVNQGIRSKLRIFVDTLTDKSYDQGISSMLNARRSFFLFRCIQHLFKIVIYA